MEVQVERLVQKAWKRYNDTPPNQRLLIAISGIPGSGKTSLASAVTHGINKLAASTTASSSPNVDSIAVFVPMDGYHFTRAQLSAMPDPEEAHFRRGAAFTFDAPSFLKLLRRVREPITPSTSAILAPSFDHKVKDPVDDAISIPASARVVVFEGNYLSLQKDEWAEISSIVDERWFVDVDWDVAKERLAHRHAAAGIVDTVEKGRERAELTDLLNGKEIMAHRGPTDEIITSREDETWRPEAQNSKVAIET